MATPKFIKATVELTYLAPEYSNWDRLDSAQKQSLMDDWFGLNGRPFRHSHAYRDGSRIGLSEKILKVEEIDQSGKAFSVFYDTTEQC